VAHEGREKVLEISALSELERVDLQVRRPAAEAIACAIASSSTLRVLFDACERPAAATISAPDTS